MSNMINEIAIFRLAVLGGLTVRKKFEYGELTAQFVVLSEKDYQLPNGKYIRLSAKTIERWYYAFSRRGIEGLIPLSRKNKGQSKLPEAIQLAIIGCKKDNPVRSINTIIQLLELSGKVAVGSLTRSSVYRLLHHHGLSSRRIGDVEKIERRAFEAHHAGDVWYGDVMHGPKIQTQTGQRKVYLVSLMDDASRLLCHSEFCFDETALSIEYVLKQAVLKRGLPKRFVVDNGPAYRSDSLQWICAKLGIQLIYCKPYEPEGKGKLERFHRTFREQFLTELSVQSLYGLSELNSKLWSWIEMHYHNRPHAGLKDHLSPLKRYQQDLSKLIPLGDKAGQIDHYFYHRKKRLIRKDGTFQLEGQLYEVDFELMKKTVTIVYEPHENKALWVENDAGEKLSEVYLLNKIANLSRKRSRPEPKKPALTSPVMSLVDEVEKKTKQHYDITLPNNTSGE